MSQKHGETQVAESTAEDVLGRRKYHVTAARWVARWSYPLMWLFAVIGLFFVLLPVLSNSWRETIELLPVTAWVFHEFSTFGPVTKIWFLSLAVSFSIVSFMAKHYPGGWDQTKEGGFPGPKDMFEKKLYPRTGTEEFVFWADFILRTVLTVGVLYFPFGILAFFIRLGG